jgi:hypothetical protein
MKLSKIILENKRIIERAELNISEEDINKLTEAISNKLEDYLDIGNRALIQKVVSSAINELIQENEI